MAAIRAVSDLAFDYWDVDEVRAAKKLKALERQPRKTRSGRHFS